MVVLLRSLETRNESVRKTHTKSNGVKLNWLDQGCLLNVKQIWDLLLANVLILLNSTYLTFSLSFDHFASNHVTTIASVSIGPQIISQWMCVFELIFSQFWFSIRVWVHLPSIICLSSFTVVVSLASVKIVAFFRLIIRNTSWNVNERKEKKMKSRWKYTSNGNALKIICFTLRFGCHISFFLWVNLINFFTRRFVSLVSAGQIY